MSKQDHINARRRPYSVACDKSIFDEDELELLSRYGSWLEALTTGKLVPYSDAQQRFVDMHRGRAAPLSKYEKVWYKYQAQRIFELARSLDKQIETHGSAALDYYGIRALYFRAAALGHPKAHAKMGHLLGEGVSWVSLELPELTGRAIPRPRRDASLGGLPATAFQKPSSYSDSGSTTYTPDWGQHGDDLGSEYWDRFMGGPDID
jgi:uncharacterized protein YifE (UPF0438 family)